MLFRALAPVTTAAYWSLVRSRGHYPSAVLVGGGIGLAVALVAGRIWPHTDRTADDEQQIDTGGEA